LVQGVVEEERVEMVPLEPRCGPFQIAGGSVLHEQSVTGEREGEPVPFPRQEETRILTHRLRRRKGSRGMLRGELRPDQFHVLVRKVSIRLQQGFESCLRRLRTRRGHRVTLSRASSQLAVGGLTMAFRSWSSGIEVDPGRNIAALSSSMTARSSATTASAETFAASSIGIAIPAIDAPRAIPFPPARP